MSVQNPENPSWSRKHQEIFCKMKTLISHMPFWQRKKAVYGQCGKTLAKKLKDVTPAVKLDPQQSRDEMRFEFVTDLLFATYVWLKVTTNGLLINMYYLLYHLWMVIDFWEISWRRFPLSSLMFWPPENVMESRSLTHVFPMGICVKVNLIDGAVIWTLLSNFTLGADNNYANCTRV